MTNPDTLLIVLFGALLGNAFLLLGILIGSHVGKPVELPDFQTPTHKAMNKIQSVFNKVVPREAVGSIMTLSNEELELRSKPGLKRVHEEMEETFDILSNQ